MSNTPWMEPWHRRPLYKYGMLFLFAGLAVVHFWTLAGDSPRYGSSIGLVVVLMLTLNHVVLTFLDAAQRRRAIPLQFTVLIGGVVYAAVTFWQQFGAR